MKRAVAFLTSLLLLGTTGCGAGPVPEEETSSVAPSVEDTAQNKREDEADETDMEKEEKLAQQVRQGVKDRRENLTAISQAGMESLNAFNLKAAPLLLAEGEKNRVCSPVSLYLALSMLAETTDGGTRAEILDALGLPDVEAARTLTGNLFDALCFDNDVGKLTLANSLWLNQNYPFREGIADTVNRNYRAGIYGFDDANPADGQRIADWIAENTGGKLTPGPVKLDAQSLAFLINAIYYKDQWTHQMFADQTAPAAFTLSDGTEITCDFMRADMERMYYAEGDGWVKVSKEFRNGGAMSFILPAGGSTPGWLLSDEARLSEALNGKMELQFCNLRLPKFDFQTDLDLNDAVKALGIQLAFDGEQSDFSPLTEVKPVAVTEIKQGAAVTVDENGCEAAAYTMISIAAMGALPDSPMEIVLDRPFLFTIEGPRLEDGSSGPILFLGAVENPAG